MNATQAGGAVVRNTFWNILGAGLPILLALVTFPVLIHSIGANRFGVLAIAWVVLGYFGLFDLGLGRATTRFLAEASEHGRVGEVRALFWTSLILNAFLGLIGGLVLAVLSPLLVREILNIPTILQPEALGAFYLMALSVPLVTLTTAIRGALEAQHRFGLLNALQVPTSTLTYVAPLLVLPFSVSLTWLVGALVISRLLGMVVFLVATLWKLENPFAGPFFLRKRLKSLFSYGGWLTVTNVIGPFMVYADRFVIGSLSSMSAVTYYATPYEAVTRLWILPHSLTRTLFPIFSAGAEPQRTASIYANSMKHLALILTPIVLIVVVFAPDLLRLWIGETFAENSTLVLQILVVGVLINSLATVPYALIQGLGRPDITAKFHLLELPFYLLFLWYGVEYWGIVGAALAWTVCVGADGFLLALYVWMSGSISSLPGNTQLPRTLVSASLLVVAGWILFGITDDLFFKVVAATILFILASYGTWRSLLTSTEQEKLTGFNRKIVVRLIGKHSASEDRRADR